MKLGMHGLFYTTEPEAARAFLRDKLQIPSFDSGGGWLIFDLASADLGCHPSDRAFHAVSFSCDDIDAAVAELRGRDVTCTPIVEEEWGRVTTFELPGGGPIQLYQAKYRCGSGVRPLYEFDRPQSDHAHVFGRRHFYAT